MLFECEDSRCPLKSDSTKAIVDLVLFELMKYNEDGCICLGLDKNTIYGEGEALYVLQRWCVNVARLEDIQDGDRLTVIRKSTREAIVSFITVDHIDLSSQ